MFRKELGVNEVPGSRGRKERPEPRREGATRGSRGRGRGSVRGQAAPARDDEERDLLSRDLQRLVHQRARDDDRLDHRVPKVDLDLAWAHHLRGWVRKVSAHLE